MDLDVERCSRCGRLLSGSSCGVCAKSSAPPPRSRPPAGEAASARAEGSQPLLLTLPEVAPPADGNPWLGRGVGLALALVVAGLGWSQCGDRPSFLGLATEVEGPSPRSAASVLFFLHGYGGSNDDVDWVAPALRKAGLRDDVSIVFVEGPFASGFGRHWGDDGASRLIARERVRAAIQSTLGAAELAADRVFVAGFSQGAQLAANVATAEPRVGGFAAIAPCSLDGNEEIHDGLSVLLAHGKRDSVCRFAVSAGLAERLASEGADVTFVDFDGDHQIAPAAIEALVALVQGPAEAEEAGGEEAEAPEQASP